MRLDHLLSKEHTPRCQANVLARMVVFTSGIVDDHRTRLRLGGQACGSGWLLVASRWWGTGSGTLLGPEESAGRSPFHGGWVGVGASGPLFVCSSRWWGVGGLVGLLFEICIVDASIYSSLIRIFWIGLLLEQFE